jgi:hypothetical protein
MGVVRAAPVFRTLAIPRIDTEHSHQRSILDFSEHRVAAVVVGAPDGCATSHESLYLLPEHRPYFTVRRSPNRSLQARQYVRGPRGGHRPPEREYESRRSRLRIASI